MRGSIFGGLQTPGRGKAKSPKTVTMSWNSDLQVRAVSGPEQGLIVHLNSRRMTIGRRRNEEAAAEGWVLVSDKAISRQHAELSWNDKFEGFEIHHLSKTNFTWLDEEPLEGSSPIQPGQVIRMGATELVLESATELPEQTPPQAVETPDQATTNLKEVAPKAIGFKGDKDPVLVALHGPVQGTEISLNGLYITLGRGNLQADALTGDPKAAKFDQMVELSDPSIAANHLLLKWDALKNGFSTWKNPAVPNVVVQRVADGCNWVTEIADQAAVLRVGDSFVLGQSTFQLR